MIENHYEESYFIDIFFLSSALIASNYSFSRAVERLMAHHVIAMIEEEAHVLHAIEDKKSSTGDPTFKISGKNYSTSFERRSSTNLVFSLQKKIPLTKKYAYLKDTYSSLAASKKFESALKKRELLKKFWIVLILQRTLERELQILLENKKWLNKILQISKVHYANGKVSQEALLELQIQNSELDMTMEDRRIESENLRIDLEYLLNVKDPRIVKTTIPWKILEEMNVEEDERERQLLSLIEAKNSSLKSSELASIPDLTLSIHYSKKMYEDHVSIDLSFPLPFTKTNSAEVKKTLFERNISLKRLKDYQNRKTRKIEKFKNTIKKYLFKLRVLEKSSIRFSKNSTQIMTKAYEVGAYDYFNLLKSKIKRQHLMLEKNRLESALSITRINYKYVLGDTLL